MKIGLWNIDHPELRRRVSRNVQRFQLVLDFLVQQNYDVYVLTEANSALELPGYVSYFSSESPFTRKGRCYDAPNQYHQVGIYSLAPLSTVDIDEPVNGLLCHFDSIDQPLYIYGNVVTIKDQWAKDSDKTYTDRLNEQLATIGLLATKRCVVCGDFNLRLNWPQKKKEYNCVKRFVSESGWKWPTANRTDTVQHVMHSPDLHVSITLDLSVKERGLSDHPFITADISDHHPNARDQSATN